MDPRSLRIVFMGTPDFAVESLRHLHESGYKIIAVVTAPDKPRGRGQKIAESAVKRYAVGAGLPLLQPVNLKDPAFVQEFKALDADLGIVIAFRMLPEVIWSAPRLGTFNLHASLLPQYRGAAPINRAIMNGETTTGITTFMLNAGMDTGDIIARRQVAISPDHNAGSLHDRLMEEGKLLVSETVDMIASANYTPLAQDYEGDLMPAPKIFREDCRIDWSRTPEELYDFIRGLSPYPGAWSYLIPREPVCVLSQTNERGEKLENDCAATVALPELLTVKIFSALAEPADHSSRYGTLLTDDLSFLKVACRKGWISVKELQIEGKKRMGIEEFLRGFKNIKKFDF